MKHFLSFFKQMSQPKTHRANKTALPLSILVLIVGVGIVIGQHYLSDLEIKSETIVVGSNAAEGQEENNDSFTSLKALDTSQSVMLLADTLEQMLIKKELPPEKSRDFVKSHLKTDIHAEISTLVYVIDSLTVRKDFALLNPILLQLSQVERDEYDRSFIYAKSLSKVGQKPAAMDEYKRIIQMRPNHQPAIINLGLLLQGSQQFSEAKTLYVNALDIASGQRKAKIYAGLGNIYMYEKSYDLAIENFEKSIEYRPSSALTWRKLLRAKIKASLLDSEIDRGYQQALRMSPGDLRLQKNYAEYLISQLHFEKAVVILRKILSANKNDFQTRLLLWMTYYELKRFVNAKKQADYIEKYALTKKDKLMAKGLSHYYQDDFLGVIKAFKETLKKGRDNNFAYYAISIGYRKLDKPLNTNLYISKIKEDSFFWQLAQVKKVELRLSKKDKSDEPQQLINELLTKFPKNADISSRIARTAYKAGKYDMALLPVLKAISLEPNQREHRLLHADILWRLDKKQEAIDTLKQLTEKNPSYKRALYRISDYYDRLDNVELSLTRFQQLLALDRDYGDALYRTARLQNQKQQNQQSISLLSEFLQSKGDHVKARTLYARNFCEMNQIKECHKQLELAMKFAPNDKVALQLRVQYPYNAQ